MGYGFPEGALVRLATGGPAMIVQGPARSKGHLWCSWIEGGIYCFGSFEQSSLVVYDPAFEPFALGEYVAGKFVA